LFAASTSPAGGKAGTRVTLKSQVEGFDSHAVQRMLPTVTSARRIDYQLLPRAE